MFMSLALRYCKEGKADGTFNNLIAFSWVFTDFPALLQPLLA